MITIVAPSPSVHVTYRVPGFSLGAVNHPTSVHRVPGGRGLNVARAAHRLGAEVAAVAVLGGDGGNWIVSELARLGLPLDIVPATAPTRTCVSIADDDRHTMTKLHESAAPVTPDEWDQLVRTARDAMTRRPGWVTVSGSMPAGAGPGAVSTLIELAHRAGRAVAVDVRGSALHEALEAGADVVKVNAAEAAEVLRTRTGAAGPSGATGPDGDGAAELAARLAGRLAVHARVGAVVTVGVDGAVAVTADGASRRVRSTRRGPYPVGSGDSFLAGLVTSLDAGRGLLDALAPAAAVATANALLPGPACFTDADLDAAFEDLELREVQVRVGPSCR